MEGSTEFWLLVHRLANALRAAGRDRKTRQQAISQVLSEMPPVAVHEVMRDYRLLLHELWLFESDLRPVATLAGEKRHGTGRTATSAA